MSIHLYWVHWIDACDFMILSLKLSVFFVLLSNFWIVWLVLLPPPPPHVLFINSCTYWRRVFFSPVLFVDSVKIFSVWIANDYWLMYVCVCAYVLTWNWTVYGTWWTRFLFCVLIVNWQLLVYQAKCVGKQSNINSNLYLGWEIRTRTIYLYMRSKNSCDSQFRATLYVLISHDIYRVCVRMFFFPSARTIPILQPNQKPLLVWFKRQKKLNEATANNFALWLGLSCSAIYQCRSILHYQIHPSVCIYQCVSHKIQSQKDRTAILSYNHHQSVIQCSMPHMFVCVYACKCVCEHGFLWNWRNNSTKLCGKPFSHPFRFINYVYLYLALCFPFAQLTHTAHIKQNIQQRQ